MFLSGEAFNWWRDIDEAPGGPLAQGIVSTDIFFEKLKARFIQHNDSLKAKTTLQNLTQKPGQSAQQLAVTFRELARIVAVHMTPMDTTTQAEIFLKALHPRLRERVKLCTTVPGMLYDFELLVEQTVLVEQASPELLIAGPKTNEFTNSGDRDRRQGRDNRQKNEKSVVDVALASAPGYTYAHAMSGIKRSRFRPDQFQPPQNRRDPQQGFGHNPQAEFGPQPRGEKKHRNRNRDRVRAERHAQGRPQGAPQAHPHQQVQLQNPPQGQGQLQLPAVQPPPPPRAAASPCC